jgi:hypothetical protein
MAPRLAALFLAFAACAAVQAAPPADERPGYGVVQSIQRLPGKAAEPSASAGASSPSRTRSSGSYLVRVKLDDGSIQVRQVKKREVAVGQRVLITNAGDVLPE